MDALGKHMLAFVREGDASVLEQTRQSGSSWIYHRKLTLRKHLFSRPSSRL
jgi:hypothetical protein